MQQKENHRQNHKEAFKQAATDSAAESAREMVARANRRMEDRILPEEDLDLSLNGNFTAIPKGIEAVGEAGVDLDLVATPFDHGEMNARDAKEAGYIGEDGKAMSLAKHDVHGSPTGAYTDIGEGRSSVVHSKDEIKK